MAIIQRQLSNGKTILIEAPVVSTVGKVSKKAVEVVDEFFDEIVQNEIIEYSAILIGAFTELREQSIPPTKASAEFGIQGSAEGNVYLAKVSGQASIKVSLEWNLAKDETIVVKSSVDRES